MKSPTMEDAAQAVDGSLLEEQAALLRECRAALNELLERKPALAGMLCGSTTLGNLRASLYEYRPRGVMLGNSTADEYWNRPCAAVGLESWRATGRYGWVMIGATGYADAYAQALRSTDTVRSLERWNGAEYVPQPLPPPQPLPR